MPGRDRLDTPNPREEDIVYGDRRISRPDASLPDWEMPDTAYRPIPIVWFTAAMLVQMVVLGIVFVVLSSKHGAFTVGLSAMATAAIGAWTWERGMRDASAGWKLATIAILLVQFALFGLAASGRL